MRYRLTDLVATAIHKQCINEPDSHLTHPGHHYYPNLSGPSKTATKEGFFFATRKIKQKNRKITKETTERNHRECTADIVIHKNAIILLKIWLISPLPIDLYIFCLREWFVQVSHIFYSVYILQYLSNEDEDAFIIIIYSQDITRPQQDLFKSMKS